MAAEQDLIRALEDLTDKIESMSGQFGRGTKKSGIPGGRTPEEKSRAKELSAEEKLIKDGVKTRKENNKAIDKQTDSLEDLTKAQDKNKKEQEKLERSMERAKDGFMSFGQSLLKEKTNVADALGSLGGTLSKSYSVVGRAFGGIATGVGFAIGAMQNFAESAKDMGNFADLGAFRVGSVRQAKILSGLGDSFIKVIEQSNGTFKALGGNSQDAVENLSNLSRSLRYGSGYLNSAMKKSLGTDLVKSVDKAARATAAMGLSTEDQANLEGSILASTMLNAKNEQDAQQKFVKAMTDSVTSARNLSDAFGMSAKTVLKAMEEFRKTQAGTVSSLEGNKGADQLYAVLKQFPSLGTDPAKLANVAAALAEGDMAKAQYNIRDNPEATQLLQQLYQASQGAVSKEGLNVEQFNKNIEAQRGSIEAEYASRKGQQGYNDKYAAPAVDMMKFMRERDIATGKIAPDKKAAGEMAGKSEADNIQTMNSLTAAMESLRSVMVGLTAGIYALLGPLASIALSGGLGGMIATKGLKDTILTIVKLPVTLAAAAKEFYNASGGLKGMWEATKTFTSGVVGSVATFGKSVWDSTKAMYASAGGITGMLKSVKDFGLTLWSAGAKAVSSLWTMAVTAVQTVVPALIAMARSALSSVLGGFGKIGPWLARLVPMLGAFGSVLAGIGTAVGGVLAAITAPVWGIIAGVVAVGAGIIYFWDDLVDVSKALWDGFTGLVGWLADGASAIWDTLTSPFTALFDWLGDSWLGKTLGFGSSDDKKTEEPKKTSSDKLTLDQINAAKEQQRYGNTHDMSDSANGSIWDKQGLASAFAGISSPSPVNSDFAKTLSNADPSKIMENSGLSNSPGGISPETVAQLMGYLSSIQNELSAIRGNTKTDSFSAPVRLA